MDLGFLLRGAVIGFSIAAPVGPIGVLCIRRTLTEGRQRVRLRPGRGDGRRALAALLVLGVFLGSAFWWLILSSSIGLLGSKVSTRGFRWVNRLSGKVLAGLGPLAPPRAA